MEREGGASGGEAAWLQMNKLFDTMVHVTIYFYLRLDFEIF